MNAFFALPSIAVVLAVGMSMAVLDAGAAEAYPESAQLVPPAIVDQHAGTAVAVGAGFAFVGAPRDHASPAPGRVYVYRQVAPTQWSPVHTLTAPNATPDGHDDFGNAIAVSGDTLLVAAHRAAYVFERDHGGADNWGYVASLVPAGMSDDDDAIAVALSGDTAVLGSSSYRSDLDFQGRAFVFERNLGGSERWGQSTTLDSPDPMGGGDFGRAVTIDGDYLAVGQPNTNNAAAGRAYIFRRDAGVWGATAAVDAANTADCSDGGHAGATLALVGASLLMGAPDCASGGIVLAANRFTFGGNEGWSSGTYMTADAGDRNAHDGFGAALAFRGNTAAIGARTSSAAYVFQRPPGGDWTRVQRLAGSDVHSASDGFASAVAVDDAAILVGAPGAAFDDLGGSGKAYVFSDPDRIFASGFEFRVSNNGALSKKTSLASPSRAD